MSLLAAIVPKPGVALDPAKVRLALVAALAPTKIPKRIHLVDALPRNAMGKLRRDVLCARFAAD